MSISAILEVAIGLVFLYLSLSLIGTWINEWIAGLLKLRGEALKQAIRNLLKDPPACLKDPEQYLQDHPEYKCLVDKFYDHPVIKVLGKEKVDKNTGSTTVVREPGYIPPPTFATVALDVLLKETDPDWASKTGNELKALIETVPHPETREALLTFWEAGARDVQSLSKDVETWFNSTMDRLSGWYKRRAQRWSFIIGLVLAIGLNIDSVIVVQTLWREPELRASVTAYVEQHGDEFAPPEGKVVIPVDDIRGALASLELPVGWTTYAPRTKDMVRAAETAKTKENGQKAETAGQSEVLAVFAGWSLKGIGWLITALAVSQGAPFWFDVLNKVVNMRASGVVPKPEGDQGASAQK
jgi:hypothetical protein